MLPCIHTCCNGQHSSWADRPAAMCSTSRRGEPLCYPMSDSYQTFLTTPTGASLPRLAKVIISPLLHICQRMVLHGFECHSLRPFRFSDCLVWYFKVNNDRQELTGSRKLVQIYLKKENYFVEKRRLVKCLSNSIPGVRQYFSLCQAWRLYWWFTTRNRPVWTNLWIR